MKTTTSSNNHLKAFSPLAILLSSALFTAPASAQASPQPLRGSQSSLPAAEANGITPKMIKEQTKADMEKAGDERAERKASFPKLQPLLAKITNEMEPTVLEGLPHPFYNPEQVAKELNTKKTVTQHGFAFYQTSIRLSAEDKSTLTALIKDPTSFKEFSGGKLCGGFHPDFTLVWEIKGKPLEIQVCFGCGEIRAYHGEEKVYADIADQAAALRPLLEKYHKQCPAPENEG